jgi:hypothetical protein
MESAETNLVNVEEKLHPDSPLTQTDAGEKAALTGGLAGASVA